MATEWTVDSAQNRFLSFNKHVLLSCNKAQYY